MTKLYHARYRWYGHHGAVTSVAFALAGKSIISGGDDGTLRLWDLATQQESLGILAHETKIYAIRGAPDAHWIASASQAGEVIVWNWAPVLGYGRLQPARRWLGSLGTVGAFKQWRYPLMGATLFQGAVTKRFVYGSTSS